jgi:ketose-bisphosphate aldolase
MPLQSLDEIMGPAFAERYGVAAINIVNDLTLDAVLLAAVARSSPVIVQTSLKTVKAIGAEVLFEMVRARADGADVPVALHLDHCPERAWVSTCLAAGWNSVLFDGSHLDVAENQRQTAEVVAEASHYGAHVEGEIESVQGVEDDVGTDEESDVYPAEVAADFIEATGVYCFAPAIGTAHGLYTAKPTLMPERVSELVAMRPVPMVLHGGTGLSADQFADFIQRGCAKVNVSTALKIAYVDAHRSYLAENPDRNDPPHLFAHVLGQVQAMVEEHIDYFGSAGRASAA